MLADRQQAVLLAGDGNAGSSMGMRDTQKIMPRRMRHGADGEAGGIDQLTLVSLVDDPACRVDLHHIRREHVVVRHAELIDEELVLPPLHALI